MNCYLVFVFFFFAFLFHFSFQFICICKVKEKRRKCTNWHKENWIVLGGSFFFFLVLVCDFFPRKVSMVKCDSEVFSKWLISRWDNEKQTRGSHERRGKKTCTQICIWECSHIQKSGCSALLAFWKTMLSFVNDLLIHSFLLSANMIFHNILIMSKCIN